MKAGTTVEITGPDPDHMGVSVAIPKIGQRAKVIEHDSCPPGKSTLVIPAKDLGYEPSEDDDGDGEEDTITIFYRTDMLKEVTA